MMIFNSPLARFLSGLARAGSYLDSRDDTPLPQRKPQRVPQILEQLPPPIPQRKPQVSDRTVPLPKRKPQGMKDFAKLLGSLTEEGTNSKDILHGKEAIKKVSENLGRPLTNMEKRIVELEGYATRPYKDTKGKLTFGVGQTEEFIEKGFPASLEEHVNRTRALINNFDKLPEAVQIELVQGTYRGDIPGSPTFRKLFNSGKYEEAAKEFLNHGEYKKYLKKRQGGDKKAGGNIPERLEAIQRAVQSLVPQS